MNVFDQSSPGGYACVFKGVALMYWTRVYHEMETLPKAGQGPQFIQTHAGLMKSDSVFPSGTGAGRSVQLRLRLLLQQQQLLLLLLLHVPVPQ